MSKNASDSPSIPVRIYKQDWYYGVGDTNGRAFESLRHKLAVRFNWSESSILYRNENGKHFICFGNTEFAFSTFKANEPGLCIISLDLFTK